MENWAYVFNFRLTNQGERIIVIKRDLFSNFAIMYFVELFSVFIEFKWDDIIFAHYSFCSKLSIRIHGTGTPLLIVSIHRYTWPICFHNWQYEKLSLSSFVRRSKQSKWFLLWLLNVSGMWVRNWVQYSFIPNWHSLQ